MMIFRVNDPVAEIDGNVPNRPSRCLISMFENLPERSFLGDPKLGFLWFYNTYLSIAKACRERSRRSLPSRIFQNHIYHLWPLLQVKRAIMIVVSGGLIDFCSNIRLINDRFSCTDFLYGVRLQWLGWFNEYRLFRVIGMIVGWKFIRPRFIQAVRDPIRVVISSNYWWWSYIFSILTKSIYSLLIRPQILYCHILPNL